MSVVLTHLKCSWFVIQRGRPWEGASQSTWADPTCGEKKDDLAPPTPGCNWLSHGCETASILRQADNGVPVPQVS